MPNIKKNLIQISTWKKNRAETWFKKEKPFNPNEAWRKRKCRVVAPFKLWTPGFFGPTIMLSQNFQSSCITLTADSYLTPFPTCNQIPGSLFNWSIEMRQHPVFLRLNRWLKPVTTLLGKIMPARLRYKGKSFRWYRKLNSILLRFGHSHIVIVKPAPNVKWKKHGRMKLIFFGSNSWGLKQFLQRAIKWRPMNIYHGRGLRLIQQKVKRKAGKVSAYR